MNQDVFRPSNKTYSRSRTSRKSCRSRRASFSFLSRGTSFSFSAWFTILSLHIATVTACELTSFTMLLAYHFFLNIDLFFKAGRCCYQTRIGSSLKTSQSKINKNIGRKEKEKRRGGRKYDLALGRSLSKDCEFENERHDGVFPRCPNIRKDRCLSYLKIGKVALNGKVAEERLELE